MDIVEETDDAIWQERERHWIFHFKEQGANLLNHTEGGDGVHNPTPETRYRMGASNRGKRMSEEQRSKISAANRGMKMPPGFSEKIAERNRGRKLSADTREKIGAHHRGKVISEAQRRAVSDAHRGRPMPEWKKQVLREAAAQRKRLADEAAQFALTEGLSMSQMHRRGISLRAIGRVFGVCNQTVKSRLEKESVV